MTVTAELIKAFDPTGVLRASLNMGNPVLANVDSHGQPYGISIDLARALGAELNMPVELVVNKTAGASVKTMESGNADIGFFAIDPDRGREIAFTWPYLLIEGFYLVRDTDPITRNDQVDVAGKKVVVGKGSAYDLFLSSNLTKAEIIHAASSQAVVPTFVEQHIDVAAGVKQQLQMDTKGMKGVRLLPERFMVIRQAMGVAKDRGPEAALFLRHFVEKMKTEGFVKHSMTRHNIDGANVAPPDQADKDPLA